MLRHVLRYRVNNFLLATRRLVLLDFAPASTSIFLNAVAAYRVKSEPWLESHGIRRTNAYNAGLLVLVRSVRYKFSALLATSTPGSAYTRAIVTGRQADSAPYSTYELPRSLVRKCKAPISEKRNTIDATATNVPK